ncbi:LysM peptidoglycan-binding domain-containing protein [Actinokineospora pegani]|uniref:LysM peptidoglycan-binding domain-containing protein n=1 Tax=Actinokineospora pegani TaxID=2654637 RepID=UPI0012EAAD19|nr:hypothetical protein [Actinokineospora pegani]
MAFPPIGFGGGDKLSQAFNLGLALTGNAKAMLVPVSGGFSVVFTLNPAKVQVEKTNKTEGERSTVDSSFKDAVKASGNVKIRLDDGHLTGALMTQTSIDRLMEWSTPAPAVGAGANLLDSAFSFAKNTILPRFNPLSSTSGTPGGDSSSLTKVTGATASPPVYYKLPVLRFMWGVGGPSGAGTLVNLESFKINYKRFDGSGIPVWAKVDLTLVEYTEKPPGTNPTSGGLPGRTRHVVTQGEGVVQVATRTYGSPQAWRAVAEANDLDDPLRVKPGRQLRLPAPGERS